MTKKRINFKRKNIITLIIFLACFIILFFALKNVIKWKLESNRTEQQAEQIQEIVDIEETEE